ncbi:ETC complex I subunit conserved family protein [Heterostelium album PN500]|uniref:NADH dehydrogenase [ubiquinone] iron-sulfur protein 4, mitochondrial n=1 Tax=Heterostelium pallidum (strain ATCC 26659 / Pp 5 / PN500) TaxID=670386 RepID=D3BP74_HETP5|nr:ETC complex I subunit conserved family protein [Heterostelium album PN500]EFA77084.1 ETC complex I subunit conserved family protein [Heterostelium album PN500]|eukprot:XP_020429213.1 ETC complex I subunit conserved family protein [Heterostelium album PN500]
MRSKLITSSCSLTLLRRTPSIQQNVSMLNRSALVGFNRQFSTQKPDDSYDTVVIDSNDLKVGTHEATDTPSNLHIRHLVNGIKVDGKTVLIYRPSRITMQSGTLRTRKWRLELPIVDKWHDGLMGWWASAGTLGQVQLAFDSEAGAISYCKENGLNYEVLQEDVVTTKKKRYGYRFLYKGELVREQEDESNIK